MSSMVAPLLLAPKQAHSLKNENKNVSFLDASWFMPNSPRRPRQEFISKRIPGAQFLDLDEVSSPHELDLKHMMPEERVFADACDMILMEYSPRPELSSCFEHSVTRDPAYSMEVFPHGSQEAFL
ncbi:hypothetical protein C0989_011080 [Termitomyces sp. Mn162]|nr:hypothetical protein C0989_011080 [Termitomyces sp. Mn162]